MHRFPAVFAVLLALVVSAPGAYAHHGWTQYNSDRMVTVTGPIRQVSFEHPHAMIELEASGRVWNVVLPPPTRAAGLGLTAESLPVGRTVTVAGHPHRTEAGEMRARRITLGDRMIQLR